MPRLRRRLDVAGQNLRRLRQYRDGGEREGAHIGDKTAQVAVRVTSMGMAAGRTMGSVMMARLRRDDTHVPGHDAAIGHDMESGGLRRGGDDIEAQFALLGRIDGKRRNREREGEERAEETRKAHASRVSPRRGRGKAA